MEKSQHVFCSHLSLDDCVTRIKSMPLEFEDPWSATPLWYNIKMISPTSLLITFTGGQFRRFRRTEYLMTFSAEEHSTIVRVDFQKEMWGLPPMMTVQELNAFMAQKVLAKRIDSV